MIILSLTCASFMFLFMLHLNTFLCQVNCNFDDLSGSNWQKLYVLSCMGKDMFEEYRFFIKFFSVYSVVTIFTRICIVITYINIWQGLRISFSHQQIVSLKRYFIHQKNHLDLIFISFFLKVEV